MAEDNLWPKEPIYWIEESVLFVSIPFTWNLPNVKFRIKQKSLIPIKKVIVGGPGVYLMPNFFSDLKFVEVGYEYPGILQRVNNMATRTTTGCIRKCKFCAIGQGRIEPGGFVELNDWPDLPIVCDNNLLASSVEHFDSVIDRLMKHRGVDFNQGIDVRLITDYHAKRLSKLKSPKIRLACDSGSETQIWLNALDILLRNGVRRYWTSSYALVGFDSGPDEAWARCEFINKHSVCYPLWFHDLDCLEYNSISDKQRKLGWTTKERVRLMKRFYKAKYGGYDDSTIFG